MNPFKEVYKDAPPIAKVIVVIVAIVVVIFVFKSIKEWGKQTANKVKMEREENGFEESGETLSYPPSHYLALADSLEASMKGAGTYTNDFARVMIQLKNNLDFLELKRAFGVRDGATMQEWIAGEWMLSTSMKNALNARFRALGIKYTI